jgi:uncharacterized protein (TIGR00255 family)
MKQKKHEKSHQIQIKSMTGFGQGSVLSPFGAINVELKTLNHKHLSVNCAPFEDFFLLEERVKEVVEKKIIRGRVFVKISKDDSEKGAAARGIKINKKIAKDYINNIKNLQKELALKGELKVQDILAYPGVIEEAEGMDEKTVWPYIKRATETALDNLMRYREEEGAQLSKDFNDRLDKIQKSIDGIKKYEKQSVEAYKKKLADLSRAVTNQEMDIARLEEEVALFARNHDISEEIIRLTNHVNAYCQVLEKEHDDVGKKLDFIAQEMHREANTIGAKASDYRISNAVIGIKSEIEKIREQLKNIE